MLLINKDRYIRSKVFKYVCKKFVTAFEAVKIIGIVLFFLAIVTFFIKYFALQDFIVQIFLPFDLFLQIPQIYGFSWFFGILNSSYALWGHVMQNIALEPLTIRQITVLGVLVLMFHGIAIESVVLYEFGVRVLPAIFFRLFSAILSVYMLNTLLLNIEYFQTVAVPIISLEDLGFKEKNTAVNFFSILLINFQEFVLIYLMVVAVLFVHDFLHNLKVIQLICIFVRPIFKLVGIKKENEAMLIAVFFAGLLQSSGLIKEELDKRGEMNLESNKNLFLTLLLMSLSHSLIEDTLVIYSLGSSLYYILFYRLFMVFLLVYILSILLKFVSEKFFYKNLFTNTKIGKKNV